MLPIAKKPFLICWCNFPVLNSYLLMHKFTGAFLSYHSILYCRRTIIIIFIYILFKLSLYSKHLTFNVDWLNNVPGGLYLCYIRESLKLRFIEIFVHELNVWMTDVYVNKAPLLTKRLVCAEFNFSHLKFVMSVRDKEQP